MKLFKHTNIKTANKTKNTITDLLSRQTPLHSASNNTTFNKSRIYRLNCRDCDMRYIGRTGQSFLTRYREHFRDYKYNNGTLKYAQHLLDNKHCIGSINNTMEVLHVMRKGKIMDTLEKFHIYNETKLGQQIDDKNTVTQNILFDTVIQKVSDREHP